jgi:hypothetical protein
MKILVVFAVAIGCFLGLIEALQSFDLEAAGIFGVVLAVMFLMTRRVKNLFR